MTIPLKHDDEWEDSVEPLTELIYEHTHLSPAQAELVARALLGLAQPD